MRHKRTGPALATEIPYREVRKVRISSPISREVKTVEETTKRVRTGVAWMGLSRKLNEKR